MSCHEVAGNPEVASDASLEERQQRVSQRQAIQQTIFQMLDIRTRKPAASKAWQVVLGTKLQATCEGGKTSNKKEAEDLAVLGGKHKAEKETWITLECFKNGRKPCPKRLDRRGLGSSGIYYLA
jgi:hypothetical protein